MGEIDVMDNKLTAIQIYQFDIINNMNEVTYFNLQVIFEHCYNSLQLKQNNVKEQKK